MRTFMVGTLLMTFLSGATSGYLVGSTTADAPTTRAEEYLLLLKRQVPDITAEDLAEAQRIYEDHERRVLSLKAEAENLLRDQLDWVENHSKQKMDAILEKYESPGPGAK